MPNIEPPPIEEIQALAEEIAPVIRPLLAGKHPAVQGGALADLIATWLAGHCYPNDVSATRELRQRLLSDFVGYVELFIPICAEELGTPHDPPVRLGDHDPLERH